MECICLVLPPCLRPSQKGELVGFSLVSANTIFRGLVIEVAAISLCSGLTVCLPPRSFLPLQVKTHRAAEAFLCPSRTCVVTFARIGYAIRPTTGNWRNEDFHLARFAALSAAHSSSKLFRTRGAESSRPASLLSTLRTHQSPGEWQDSLLTCLLDFDQAGFTPARLEQEVSVTA